MGSWLELIGSRNQIRPAPEKAGGLWETLSPRALLAVEELVELGEVDAGIEIRREQANDRRLRPR